MNNAKVNKSIKKVMRKLVGFSLSHPLLRVSAEFKPMHDSIWVKSDKAKHADMLLGLYLEIINTPKTESDIENFEKKVEDAIAHLHNENLKLKENS